MTRKDIEKEVLTALRVLKSCDMVDRPAMSFIEEAVKEKLARQEECLAVKRKDYINEVNKRIERFNNEQLGRFVRNTIWTVLEK